MVNVRHKITRERRNQKRPSRRRQSNVGEGVLPKQKTRAHPKDATDAFQKPYSTGGETEDRTGHRGKKREEKKEGSARVVLSEGGNRYSHFRTWGGGKEGIWEVGWGGGGGQEQFGKVLQPPFKVSAT